MSTDVALTAFADDFVREDDAVLAARDNADQYGVEPLSPATCSTVGVLVAALGARTIVEIGTGVGVSGLYVLRAMAPGGVLTTIDVEAEHHKSARATFAAAGFPPERTRLITGRALEVLPRLTDAGYDLVLIDGRRSEFAAYMDHALRIVRPGGMIIMAHALARGRVADPAQRDVDTTAVREALRTIRQRDDLRASMLTVGDGVLTVMIPAQ